MRSLLILFVFLSVLLPSFGQEKNGDSLIKTLEEYNAEGDFDAMVETSTELIALGSTKLRAIGYYWRGHALSRKAEYKRALRSYYTALDEYKRLNDERKVANLYGDIGIIYYEVHDLKRAEYFVLKSIRQYEKQYDEESIPAIGRSYLNIANFYLTAYSDSKDMQEAYRAQNYFVNAEDLYMKLDPSEEKTEGLTIISANRTMLYALMGDRRFLDSFDRAFAKAERSNDSSQIAMLFSAKSQSFNNLSDYTVALKWSDSALYYFPENGQPVFLIDFHKSRAEILKKLGDAEGALYSLNKVDSLERIILNSETIGDLQAISNEHEQDQLIEASNERVENLEQSYFGKRNILLLTVLCTSIVLLVVLILYMRNSRRKKRLRHELIQSKQKEADVRNKLNQVNGTTVQHSGYRQLLQEITEEIEMHERFKVFADRSKTLNPSFVVSLKETYPDLSNRDLRLCALLLIGLSSKEISILSSIEPASVDRQRYRLRKKLKLKNQEKLIVFLENI